MKAALPILLALATLALGTTSARAQQRSNDTFDLKAFHDELMSRGAPPVPWIGRRILNDPEWHPFR